MSKPMPYFTGESTSYTEAVTSAYTQHAEVPGTARNLVFEVYLNATTSAEPIDLRLVQGMPRLDAKTSAIVYSIPATTYAQKSSSFTFNITKGAYSFSLQTKLSTGSTSVEGRTVQVKWIGIT